MSGLNDPKDKKIAEALAAIAIVPSNDKEPRIGGTPLSWFYFPDGSFALVLAEGPKYTYSAEEVAAALAPKEKPAPPAKASAPAKGKDESKDDQGEKSPGPTGKAPGPRGGAGTGGAGKKS